MNGRKEIKWGLKFVSCSSLGIFMFFCTVTFQGKNTIPLDHITTAVRHMVGMAQSYWAVFLMAVGCLYPIYRGEWNKSIQSTIFSVFRLLGLVCGCMCLGHWGPQVLYDNPNLFPFLFSTLCVPIAFLVPIAAIFLSFLTDYGLMEFVAVFFQPIMRKIWGTPGKSAIDAVASFVGSYSLALLITDKLYQEGKYTKKEAFIIATGFSTVSTSFMIVIAKTMNLMAIWNLYFWTSLVVTFAVTAIVSKIYPTAGISTDYMEGVKPHPEEVIKGNLLSRAWQGAVDTAEKGKPVYINMYQSLRDGVRMASLILPTIMSIGLLGMLLALFTPFFKGIGYVFYPFVKLLDFPDALYIGQALATSIAEMFLPTAFVLHMDESIKFMIGVVSVSELLFFSALIPCILATKITVKISHLLVLWVERVVLSIVLVGIFIKFIF